MRNRNRLLLTATLGLVVLYVPPVAAQRRVIETAPILDVSHERTAPRSRMDPEANRLVLYDPQGAIRFRPDSGDYLLTWIGREGSVQEVVWEPPTRVRAIVAGEVTFDDEVGLYTYTYRVTNLPESPQRAQRILVEAAGVIAAARPDSGWSSWAITHALRERLNAAEGWGWGHVYGDDLGIPPGTTVTGFRVVSPHPPGIVKVFLWGSTPGVWTDEDIPLELDIGMEAVQFNLPVGRTIGPVPLPVDAPMGQMAQRLEAFMDEAEREGWLGPLGATGPVRDRLVILREAANRGDEGGVRREGAWIRAWLDDSSPARLLSEAEGIFRAYLRMAGIEPPS